MAVLDVEPEPRRHITESRLDDVARAFADMTDLKSPYMLGHSTGVSRLAETAAIHLGLPVSEAVRIRRAGLLQDLGRVGVPNGIWDKAGPLTTTEWEQVRLHPYHSERILSRSIALAPLAQLAGMHHERLDGSGYYRQATAASIPAGARLLAVADAYQAMIQRRAHRSSSPRKMPPQSYKPAPIVGVSTISAYARSWRSSASPRSPLDVSGPPALPTAKSKVLRLAAQGFSNRQIGDALSISPKTADHHIQHIYTKIGVSTRAGAAIFAMEHDLLHSQLAEK